MKNPIIKNCHYVSESMTQPWEGKQRTLHYFDYGTGRIGKAPSKTLLAEDYLLTPQQEAFFSRYIERPLGMFKANFIRDGKVDITQWSIYRAIMLYFVFQAQRYAMSLEKGVEGVDLFELSEEKLDQIALIYKKKYNLSFVVLPPDQFCCVPESGIYQVPMNDMFCATGWQFTYCLPITPRVILYLQSKTVVLENMPVIRSFLHHFSVGLNDNCRKVIFPAPLLDSNSAEFIENYFREARALITKEVTEIHAQRERFHDMLKNSDRKFEVVSSLKTK